MRTNLFTINSPMTFKELLSKYPDEWMFMLLTHRRQKEMKNLDPCNIKDCIKAKNSLPRRECEYEYYNYWNRCMKEYLSVILPNFTPKEQETYRRATAHND